MSIESHIQGILRVVATHPPSLEEAEIVRLTLKIQRHYAEIKKRADQGDTESHSFPAETAAAILAVQEDES